MFTKSQITILDWAKKMKSHKRTHKLEIDWRWTDTGKKTAFVYQEYVDCGVPRKSETKVFTAAVDKFDAKFQAAQEYIERP